MSRIRAAIIALVFALPTGAWAETLLLMAEEDGCFWCERWNDEIAEIYPKTAEGKAAPLRRYDLHGPVPADVTLTSSVRFSPTFLLIRDGIEVERLEGYPGEDFFWGLLALMLDRAGVATDETG